MAWQRLNKGFQKVVSQMERPRDFDYLEDKNGCFYKVIGNFHPPARIRVCLSYVPTSAKSQYAKNGMCYLKVSDETGYLFVKDNFPELMYRDPSTQQEFLAIPIKNVKQKCCPRSKLRQIITSTTHPVLNNFVLCLDKCGISENQIGIHGSLLLELKEEVHDYDIVIYGFRNLRAYKESLPKLNEAGFRQIDEEGLRNLTLGALRNHPIGFEQMYLAKLSRRDTLLLSDQCLFSIHFSYEKDEGISEQIGKPISPLRIEGTLLDGSQGFFVPYTYPIQVADEIYQVIAYSFAYYSVASEGEEVEAFGELRENRRITIDRPYHYITPLVTRS